MSLRSEPNKGNWKLEKKKGSYFLDPCEPNKGNWKGIAFNQVMDGDV